MMQLDSNLYMRFLTGLSRVFQMYGHQIDQRFSGNLMQQLDIRGAHDPNMANAFYQQIYNTLAHRYQGGQVPDQAIVDAVNSWASAQYNHWRQVNGMNNQGYAQQGYTAGYQQQPMPMQPVGNTAPMGAQPTQTYQQPQQQATTQAKQEKPFVYSPSPLDDPSVDGMRTEVSREQANWGPKSASDNSIILKDQSMLSIAEKGIHVMVGNSFVRGYFSDPMDVVINFFETVPESFRANYYNQRLFYRHVEVVEASTETMRGVRDDFIEKLNSARPGASTYTLILEVLDKLSRGDSKAICAYLLKHINRTLELYVGINRDITNRIRFTAIEDIDELLGVGFEHPILSIPNARGKIVNLINATILNALAGYSDILFPYPDRTDADLVKSSSVFPFNMENVYPSKHVIPSNGSPAGEKFRSAFWRYCLDKRTYMVSLRSVTITDILGERFMRQIGDSFSLVKGAMIGSLNDTLADHASILTNKISLVEQYDELSLTPDSVEDEYLEYLKSPEKYHDAQIKHVAEFDIPTFPVDSQIFCVGHKKDPKDGMFAIDVGTTLDADDIVSGIIARRAKVKSYHVV